jgi:hypothetical protein
MSQVRTVAANSAEKPDSRLLRCVECGNFCAARSIDDELVPLLGTPGGQCAGCGEDEFEQVVLELTAGSERD